MVIGRGPDITHFWTCNRTRFASTPSQNCCFCCESSESAIILFQMDLSNYQVIGRANQSKADNKFSHQIKKQGVNFYSLNSVNNNLLSLILRTVFIDCVNNRRLFSQHLKQKDILGVKSCILYNVKYQYRLQIDS